MSDKNTAKIDGIDVEIKDEKTILDHAKSLGKDIPTLCHDDRLDPNGCCIMCHVEVDSWTRMAPSCATKITPGMNITTENERIDRHRKTHNSRYLSDHPENPKEKENDGKKLL